MPNQGCGRVLGHGEVCCEGHLCGACETGIEMERQILELRRAIPAGSRSAVELFKEILGEVRATVAITEFTVADGKKMNFFAPPLSVHLQAKIEAYIEQHS